MLIASQNQQRETFLSFERFFPIFAKIIRNLACECSHSKRRAQSDLESDERQEVENIRKELKKVKKDCWC